MSLERVLKTLESFGFSKVGAEVYVYLAKKGPMEVKDLANAMKLPKNQLCSILAPLQREGFVYTKTESTVLFSALEFEPLLVMMIERRDDEAQVTRETRRGLLSSWRAITRNEKRDGT